MGLTRIGFHRECLVSLILRQDDDDYSDDGDPDMCGTCVAHGERAMVEATAIVARHEGHWKIY